MDRKKLIKTLELKKGKNYLIFVNRDCILAEELAKLDLKKEFGVNNYFFVRVAGDVRAAVKEIEIIKK